MVNHKTDTRKNKTNKIRKENLNENDSDGESAISKAREILNKTKSLDKAKLALVRQAKFNSFKLFGFD